MLDLKHRNIKCEIRFRSFFVIIVLLQLEVTIDSYYLNFFSLSSFQTNQFTGMVYQTVLLPHRHSLKTGSLDEAITPNTSPAQWPGIKVIYIYVCIYIYIHPSFFLALLNLIR